MTFNPSIRAHVREAEKEAKVLERGRLEVIRSNMDTVHGRAYTLECLERSHVFTSSFNTNALTMAFVEGERNIGLQLFNDILRACPEQYVKMMQERNERDARRDRRSNGRDDSTPDDDGSEVRAEA